MRWRRDILCLAGVLIVLGAVLARWMIVAEPEPGGAGRAALEAPRGQRDQEPAPQAPTNADVLTSEFIAMINADQPFRVYVPARSRYRMRFDDDLRRRLGGELFALLRPPPPYELEVVARRPTAALFRGGARPEPLAEDWQNEVMEASGYDDHRAGRPLELTALLRGGPRPEPLAEDWQNEAMEASGYDDHRAGRPLELTALLRERPQHEPLAGDWQTGAMDASGYDGRPAGRPLVSARRFSARLSRTDFDDVSVTQAPPGLARRPRRTREVVAGLLLEDRDAVVASGVWADRSRGLSEAELSVAAPVLSFSDLQSSVRAGQTSDRAARAFGDRVLEAASVAEESPEVALGMLAGLYARWDRPEQSEFIFDQVLEIATRLTRGRGLEARMTVLRRFLQQLEEGQLRHRAQLRMGRLYYEHGDYAKAVVELPVELEEREPDRYQALAGLVKGISLIRLRQPDGALEVLTWVARRSPDPQQQARAAFLLGRLHMLYRRHDEARAWLEVVVNDLAGHGHTQEARALLEQLSQQTQGAGDESN